MLTGSELSELESSVQQLCRSALCIGAEDIEPLLNSLTTTTAKLVVLKPTFSPWQLPSLLSKLLDEFCNGRWN